MTPSGDDLVALGIIRKPHGVRGEASVELWADDPHRFDEVDQIILVSPDREQRRTTAVESVRIHGSRVLLKFSELDSPEQVGEVRSWTIEIPENERRDLEENEYWLDDLPGLEVEDRDGRVIGSVTSCLEGGGGFVLEIERPDGTTFDAPFVKAFFPEIDVAAKRMVADLPEGLEKPEEASTTREKEKRPYRKERPRRDEPSLVVDVVTIFPEMIEPVLSEGVLAKAIEENLVEVRIRDLREFSADRHRSTDDAPYGGGAGMVMSAEPLFSALDAIDEESDERPRVIYLSPQGRRLDQALVKDLAENRHLVLLCGRYEGIDQRVLDDRVDEELSIGDLVVSGGELPAMLLLDAVSRMVPGVVGDRNSVVRDSFYNGLLDHPHYTRPASLRGMEVPEVLLSGHAERIRKWKKIESLRATMEKRPDLLEKVDLDDESREMLEALRAERDRAERSER